MHNTEEKNSLAAPADGRPQIDFVVSWVDGSDPAWLREYAKYRNPPVGSSKDEDTEAAERYRDWDLMRYWFRAVEKFAPWVRRVHFVTWRHLPPWLDDSNPRIQIIRHEDYIPSEYLPVFSSCPIELLMHRIDGLSDRFVYFNDDTFLCRPVEPERFFRNGLPCDMARLSIPHGELSAHNELEYITIINKRYDKGRSIGRNPGKWFNRRYGAADMLKTLSLLPWSFFPGFKIHHLPQPFLRTTFERLWSEEEETLARTCRNRFRMPTDLSQWVMRGEQLARGDFSPHGYRDSLFARVSDEGIDHIADAVREQTYAMICINDNGGLAGLEAAKDKLKAAFEHILPEKSSFEK